MKIIKHSDIVGLNISPLQYMEWVDSALRCQYQCVIPSKISVHLPQDGFFNAMPCYIPSDDVMGVKVVNRYTHKSPALDATMILYCSSTGELRSLMDATLITTMRTGAVAATSIIELKNLNEVNQMSVMGLGVTARATVLCLLESLPNEKFEIKLLRYKDQAELFAERFKVYDNAKFKIVDSYEDLIVGADIIVSCITSADRVFGQDEWFKPGVLVVPVHTRGFQNCDLFFDKVFGDLTGQISGFKYFEKFKSFEEFAKVKLCQVTGRDNAEQRILVYNIGMALHDVYIGSKISTLVENKVLEEVNFKQEISKFYI